MGGYGYNQTNSSPQLQGVNHSDGSNNGNPAEVGKLASTIGTIGSQMGANAAAESGMEETVSGIMGAGAGEAAAAAGSTAAASAAASAAVTGTAAVAGGATAGEMGAEAILALLFYGGETVSQIKSNKAHQVNVVGSTGLKTGEDKTFYKNVHIPRKKV